MTNDDMTAAEAAVTLRLSIRAVQALCRTGTLDCRKVGARWSISRVSVLAYIARVAGKPGPKS